MSCALIHRCTLEKHCQYSTTLTYCKSLSGCQHHGWQSYMWRGCPLPCLKHHALKVMEIWAFCLWLALCPHFPWKHLIPYDFIPGPCFGICYFLRFLNWLWTHRSTLFILFYFSLSWWLLMSSAGEITLRSLLCANLINALCLHSFVPPWCRHAINHLHKPLLWDSPEKSWHVQSSTLPFSLSLEACDFHQECFIWILYYMCCPKVLKGSFNTVCVFSAL